MKTWWRTLALDEKIGAVGWAAFVVFLVIGTWIGR